MPWRSALAGGVIGFLLGLFFKSLILVLITLNVPSVEKYLVDTFVPAHGISNPDFIRFFTVPLPFALLGAAIGALKYGGRGGATTPAVPETQRSEERPAQLLPPPKEEWIFLSSRFWAG